MKPGRDDHKPKPMTASQFRRDGAALFQKGRWKHPLARRLDISYRTVLRYAQGEFAIPVVVGLAMKWLQENDRRA